MKYTEDEIYNLVKSNIKKMDKSILSDSELKKQLDEQTGKLAVHENVDVNTLEVSGYPMIYQTTEKSNHSIGIVAVHGGAFETGSKESYSPLVSQYVGKGQLDAFILDYSLTDEACFPTAIFHLCAQYKQLKKSYDKKWVLLGDSAGANLIVAMCQCLKESAVKLPEAIVLAFPWSRVGTEQVIERALSESDRVVFDIHALRKAAFKYTRVTETHNPWIEILEANLSEFPPVLIQTGGYDPLMEDGFDLYERFLSFNVSAVHLHYEKIMHAGHFYYQYLDASNRIIEDGLEFIYDNCRL